MEGDTLSDFIDDVCGESRLRVEDDLGDGFVRLRSSEAERRQAAQDIRSSEDVVIELLRNARDAGASRIFLATQKTGNERLLTVLDDGQGIPAAQHERIFEPRVTSKLDSAHMDKWGMHGRGMALYSISVNAEEARVLQSEPGLGTSLTVATDTESLAEKADQSTFPRFEQEPSGSWAMRGPKNIVRTAAEFALEHRGDLSVYLGTPVEVAATLFGTEHTPRIISLMGYKIDIAPATTSLVFEYVDAPGRIGVIGTILGDAAANITTMQIGTRPEESCALVYMNVEGDVSEAVLDRLRGAIDLRNLWKITL